MPDINDVLERLVTDSGFRAQLSADPAAALAGYELSADDVQLLAASLDDAGDDLPRGVEQRTSKSALVGLLASFAGGGAGSEPAESAPVGSAGASRSPIPMDLATDGGSAGSNDVPIESVSLNYEEIKPLQQSGAGIAEPIELTAVGDGQAARPELEEIGIVFHPIRGPEGADGLVVAPDEGDEAAPLVPAEHITINR